jgi:ketosteroid isomerase-like protein
LDRRQRRRIIAGPIAWTMDAGMTESARERLSAIYEAFRQAKVDFVLNAIDDDVEFISYSPIEVFPFLGHHRGKAAMAEVLKSGYAQFEFIAYQPVFTVCEGDDAAVIIFARFIQRKTGRSISTMIAHFLRFRNGRIVELREFMDSFHTVKQLLGRELDLEEH